MSSNGWVRRLYERFRAAGPRHGARRRAERKSFRLGLELLEDRTLPASLTIIPTFDSTITNDPNAAAIEKTINSTIAYYESTFSNPITVTIDYVEAPGSGNLGVNGTTLYSIPYATFRSALAAEPQTPDVTMALANLPAQANNPVDNTGNLLINTADIKALGIPGSFPPNQTNGFDGIITIDTAQTTPGSPGSNLNYTLFATVEHETDEVLGLGSALPNAGGTPTTPPRPEDLYRYSGMNPGTRSYTTTGDDAFFSLNGTTDLAQFNQNMGTTQMGDYGDWWSNNGGGNPPGGTPPPRVQDAFGYPNTSPTLATDAGQVELRALNVIGYEYAGTHFQVSAPAAVDKGLPFSITVSAVDQFGNVDPNYTGTVHFTSTDPSGVLPANYTFTTADAGTHTFTNGVTLQTLGNQTITATDTVISTFTGNATVDVVTALPASQFRVSAPATVLAGAPFNLTVTALDPLGNVVTNYTGTVHFTSTDPSGTLPANYTFTTADAGVHTFTNGATLRTLGSQTITATDTVTSTIMGSTSVTVTQVAAFVVSAPATVSAGVPFSVTVTAVDQSGNAVNGYTGTVHFTSTDPSGTLPANYTFTTADAGVHTFTNGVTLVTLGSQTITATDTADTTITGSTDVTVNPATPPHENVTYYVTAAGAGGAPEVKVYNAANNQLVFDFMAFNPNFTGGIRVATADVNGDGYPDIIAVPGPGGGPEVRVFSGLNGSVLMDFLAFTPKLATGLFVAGGNVSGEATGDIVVAPALGGGPEVRVFDGATGKLIRDFMAFNVKFGGGVRVATGDISGQGTADIVAAAGPTGGPQVNVYDGPTGALIESFMAYSPTFSGGVNVSTGNFNGQTDIITGQDSGGDNNVSVFNGTNGQSILQFAAPPQGFVVGANGIPQPPGSTGIRVSGLDHNGTQNDDILVSYGEGVNAVVNIYSFATGERIDYFFPFNPLFRGGVFIGSGH
jgi:hypothetical protein